VALIADVVFDIPIDHAFSYVVPPGMVVGRGQRVGAPLQGRGRVGVVVGLRDGDPAGLKPLQRIVEPVPVLSGAALELGRWAAAESLSSWGSTLLSLLPPVPRGGVAETVSPAAAPPPAAPRTPELWMDDRREDRLLESLEREPGTALVITPDREAARHWARRLDAPRLDSGAPEAERRRAWFAASRGRSRVVVGTRSALLAPLPPPATLALVDEHDPAHKPPGAPRLHSRDLLLRRAELDGSRLLLLSATPSAESWSRGRHGRLACAPAPPAPWPHVVTADTRGILRNHPLTLPLTRGIEEASRRGRRAVLIAGRRTAALACEDCGAILRCPDCGVALARERRTLRCPVCARTDTPTDRCPACGGHRLTPFGWDPDRVQASVARRFPRLTLSRDRPEAQVLIGTPALLRGLPRHSVGCVGFVALDGLLRVPDFRAGERTWQLLWAAAESLTPDGRLVIQTQHPEHYAVKAVQAQDRARFYEDELRFRAELGYPPYRRLAEISARARDEATAQALAADCAAALRAVAGLTVYPPTSVSPSRARTRRWRFVIKGPAELPSLLAPALAPFLARRRGSTGVVEVEMDPQFSG
jgi:primosomal protein N' (replication factor Y) (superfamily II helicase)